MAVSLQQWQNMISQAADLLSANVEYLSRIDALIGDGDHGVTIGKIAHLMKEKSGEAFESAPDFFEDMGQAVLNVQGGSAGPLWGVFIMGMGEAEAGAPVSEVFSSGLEGLREISGAGVGDKTMMDALIPGVEAMLAADGDRASLSAGAAAAAKGADDTVGYAAKFGRAKNYGEKSIGVKDAGACSMALFFEGVHSGYAETPKD
ncbi:MAG: DAK2 domain-containing protein [Clostridiales Family XIII bacterium]|jgi:dihydroxyacetone kinase-like protein|nr:DAK2 domain-containing protein [Clostridiales Family XIII bacterium]